MILLAEGAAWSEQVSQSLVALWTKVMGFIPNLVGMLLILIIGLIISKLLQRAAVVVLRRVHFDKAGEKTGLTETFTKVGFLRTPSEIVGLLVFWLVMLTFFISAADALGLDNVSRTIDAFVTYLPNVIGAAVIAVVGLLVASIVRSAVETALARVGFEYPKPAAKLVYGMLIVLVVTLAIGQLQLETTLINRVIEITLFAVAAALALALGFGTRDMARNVVAGVYARESFKVGAKVTVGECRGTILAVTAVNTKIRTEEGETIYVPNGQLMDTVVREQNES